MGIGLRQCIFQFVRTHTVFWLILSDPAHACKNRIHFDHQFVMLVADELTNLMHEHN